MTDKRAYVAAQGQDRAHTCHWPGGCDEQVPPALWGCKAHWMALPKRLRDLIWEAYTPGQEKGDVRVSQQYLDAATAVEDWYALRERNRQEQRRRQGVHT